MSFRQKMEEFNLKMGWPTRGIYVRVELKDGVAPGQPAKIIFNAEGLEATALAIHTREGDLLYQGGPKGSFIVEPLQTSWYVLIATNPDGLHEEEMVEIKVHGGTGGPTQGTRTWPRQTAGRHDRATQ
jgi:hypothetical protein